MSEQARESECYLQEQIITYLGNKRKLLPFIGQGVQRVYEKLGCARLRCFDAFSGSGVVARYLKKYASHLWCNDLEPYTRVLNRCYLANRDEVEAAQLPVLLQELRQMIASNPRPGLIAELYAPQNDHSIRPGERVFYTRRNAVYLDTARLAIDTLAAEYRHFFLAPLLYEASVHTNTSGIFKGFHKNAQGIGQFGGRGRNALSRIMADIELSLPVFSRFDCGVTLMQQDACAAAKALPQEIDLAYLDPPYNQHPYGSNYFMLNLLLDYKRPMNVSAVSGIPDNWQRSAYNSPAHAAEALSALLRTLPARYALLSYNSEGILSKETICDIAAECWEIDFYEQSYATFRGCRNLRKRALNVREYLFILSRK